MSSKKRTASSRKYHPDLIEAEADKEDAKQKFQKIQHAYDVLSDEKKRSMYDQLGPDFENMGAGGQPFRGQSPFGGGQEIDLNDLFGGGSPFGGRAAGGGAGRGGGFEDILRQFGGGFGQTAGGYPPGGFSHEGATQTKPPTENNDIQESVTISFHTAILGGQHQISLQRGTGKIESFKIKIPTGIESGKKIRLRGQGKKSAKTGKTGDLYVTVKVAPHPCFERRGKNLHVKLPITISEATLGAKVDLPTPHGTITVTIPAGSSSEQPLRIKGMGVKPDGKIPGDLIAELQITTPRELTAEQRELMEKFADKTRDLNPRAELRW